MVRTRGNRLGPIAARPQLAVVCLLMVGLLLAISSCMGFFQNTAQAPTLIIGKPALSGNRGEVFISVADMPNKGLASIAIDDKGITFDDIKASSIEAEGLNGFRVLASDFTTTANKGCLVAINPNSGSVGGTIIKVTFEVTGANPIFGIADADKGKVELGSALNTLISTWDLSSNETDYYAK